MKPVPKNIRQILISAVLIGIVFLVAFIFPGQINARQTTPEPTPTSTPLPGEDLALKSGDTEGLMWGAGVILFIILGGVLIQRIINRPNSRNLE
jgi:hypothetical protein